MVVKCDRNIAYLMSDTVIFTFLNWILTGTLQEAERLYKVSTKIPHPKFFLSSSFSL